MLFAYDIESLVPSCLQRTSTFHIPQKLNGSLDVQFFSVGSLEGRTLVIYMTKKGVGCHPTVSALADFTWGLVEQRLPHT
jgi:hypothetical protein